MATHSSALAWKIPWTEEPGRLQSVGSQSRTRLSDFTFPFHFHALEKEMATVYGVTQSWTGLKRLSSSSSSTAWVTCMISLRKMGQMNLFAGQA